MSMDLVRLGTIALLVTSTALELSVWIGDCPWVHFISMRVLSRVTMPLVVMNIAASSDQEVEDMTNLIMYAMARMGPL